MGVEFRVAQDPKFFRVGCACGATTLNAEFASYQEASAFAAKTPAVCGDEYCAAYFNRIDGVYVYNEDVQVSNINAKTLLEVLGLDTGDLCGSLPGEDFLGRVLVAIGLNPSDAGIPAVQNGNLVNCGRPEGYVDYQLERLHALASYADKHKLDVSWS